MKYIYLITSLLLIACNPIKKPTFERIDHLAIKKASFKETIIKADLIFNNPNSFGFEVKRTDLHIYAADQLLGDAKAEDIKITKNNEFVIPVDFYIDSKRLINNPNMLQAIMGSISSQEVELTCKGTLTLEAFGKEFDFPVYATKPINF